MITPGERKLMLARRCRVLGTDNQNVTIRSDAFNELLDARVNLEYASAQAVVAMLGMAAPFPTPAADATEADIERMISEEQERRMALFRTATVQLKGVLDISLGHLATGSQGVPRPPAS